MRIKTYFLTASLILLSACAANPSSKGGKACESGIAVATKELDFAKARGLAGTWQYTKAASLLSAARVQYEFGKYPNCIDKVERAREFIRLSKQGKGSK